VTWCFAIINGRLAEIYFDRKKSGKIKFLGHCYIKREDFKTKQEQEWIERDTRRVRLVYRNGKYKLFKQEV